MKPRSRMLRITCPNDGEVHRAEADLVALFVMCRRCGDALAVEKLGKEERMTPPAAEARRAGVRVSSWLTAEVKLPPMLRYYRAGYTLARLSASAMLLWAIDDLHPYAYYVLLRWVVCPVAAYGVLLAIDLKRMGWTWLLGGTAVLFNPLLPIHLSRGIWAFIDIAVAILLAASLPVLVRREEPDGSTVA